MSCSGLDVELDESSFISDGEKVSYISFELTVEDFGQGMPAE